MATVIKFTADGITDEMLVPSINFGLSSGVDLSNPAENADFQPIRVSEFSFSIMSPKTDTTQKLLEWITNHEIKGNAKFTINKQATTESGREISLSKVCLTSYSESIDANYSATSLSITGRIINIGDIKIDISENR
jgi:hypothetical protein